MNLHVPLAALVCSLATASVPAQQSPAPGAPRQPLVFEPAACGTGFIARGTGLVWTFAGGTMSAHHGGEEVRFSIADARHADLAAEHPLRSETNYYLGNDPTRWRPHVPNFGQLRARDVRPGVDLVHHAEDGALEFDLVVQPGGDTGDLRLHIDANNPARLLPDGTIVVAMASGELCVQAPRVYQVDGDSRRSVACRFALTGRDLRFVLGDHDDSLPLVIDPVVTFATMLGGAAGGETLKGVHLDAQGNSLVTGTTQSPDFPLFNNQPNAYRFNIAFVTKFDPAGALVFSTFFGGTSGSVTPVDIGADPNGQIVVGGNTTCPDLPTTAGVVQPVLVDGGDWFFVDLYADGSLVWCTYYGGYGNQSGMKAMKVLDVALGSVLAVGIEGSFPYMTNAYSQTGGIVVAGIYAGNTLWASSACGFSGTPTAVDVTDQGHICITGTTFGTGSGLPTTGASLQPNTASPTGFDAFVFIFTGQANSLVWATYFGGSGSDIPKRIATRTGPGTIEVTIAGDTNSTDLPLHNAIQTARGATQDGFCACIDGLSQSLLFSTYLGGNDGGETISGLAVDPAGYTVVGGSSSSSDLPFTNAIKVANNASYRDVALWRLTPTGALDWCTMWGGNGSETLVDLGVDADGQILLGGNVSANFEPLTPNAFMGVTASQDAFVVRMDPRSMTSYGSGTPGYGGFVPRLAGGGPTSIGTTSLLQIHEGRAQALGFLGAGFGRTNLPLLNGTLLTNPISLQTIVLGGSTANLFTTIGGGYLHLGFAIPNNPGFVGTTIDWQAGFLDANAFGGISLSNAVEMTIQ